MNEFEVKEIINQLKKKYIVNINKGEISQATLLHGEIDRWEAKLSMLKNRINER